MSLDKQITADEIENFRDTLKRCPAGTLDALIDFRNNGGKAALDGFLIGVLKRHVEPEYRDLLDGELAKLSFIDDLGIDSMTMMEVVMMVEECLVIRMENQDLMNIRTYGDLDGYIATQLKLKG